VIEVLKAILAVLLRIARGEGAYPPPHEPRANYGYFANGNDFAPVTATDDDETVVASLQFCDLNFDSDRTMCVEWQANNPTSNTSLVLPYGEVIVEYARGGARHTRTMWLVNRLCRIHVTGRQVRVTCRLFSQGEEENFASLTVAVSVGEARAGELEDFAPDWFPAEFVPGDPIKVAEPGVIRELSLYASAVGIYLMLFNSQAAPANGSVPDYVYGTGAIASGPSQVKWEVSVNTWYVLSSTPETLTQLVAGSAIAFFHIENGASLF
jgi:hypothetical protein